MVFTVLLLARLSLASPRFFTAQNGLDLLASSSFSGMLAAGLLVVLISGGIDISFTAIASVAQCVAMILVTRWDGGWALLFLAGLNAGTALCVGLLVACLVGGLNGLIIAYLDVSPILTTLGTMTMIKRLSIGWTPGRVISGFPPLVLFLGNASVLGVPMALILLLLVALPVAVALNRSPFGAWWRRLVPTSGRCAIRASTRAGC